LAEYIGAILAVMGLMILGISGTSIALRGDSVAALIWTMRERPRGVRVTNASMIWKLLCMWTSIRLRVLLARTTNSAIVYLVGGA
jgi:hypothetical protein